MSAAPVRLGVIGTSVPEKESDAVLAPLTEDCHSTGACKVALKQVFPDVVPSANDKMMIGHDGGLATACRWAIEHHRWLLRQQSACRPSRRTPARYANHGRYGPTARPSTKPRRRPCLRRSRPAASRSPAGLFRRRIGLDRHRRPERHLSQAGAHAPPNHIGVAGSRDY